ncbi:class I SAM-dependent methyltransferase [Rhodocaloribacter litoris]|uniref:class I SAM-dependent methyltransferase n=1 Tax=Rhodocaloribacter litoris TaxID=2558931 RepID=UPI001E340229|nr:methyltransferase [Rhodocaloribacter litoris]QXD15082.1 class I SAM-dependent methyltransferase [Rhodocaloribacter litoris]
MSCAQCRGIATFFDARLAARELKRYRRRGPLKTTRLLLDAIRTEAPGARSLLDIGGGVGAIQHALVGNGYEAGINVDASPAYLDAARTEAARLGYAHRMHYHAGDFVELAPSLPAADVVTLDRVVCCYDDVEALVTRSAAKARQVYGLVFPRVHLLTRIGFRLANAFFRLRRSPFRTYLHPPAAVDALVQQAGLTRRVSRRTLLWHVWLYAR